jgi:hypothetical protein
VNDLTPAQIEARAYIMRLQHAVMDLKPDVFEAVQQAVVTVRWDD